MVEIAVVIVGHHISIMIDVIAVIIAGYHISIMVVIIAIVVVGHHISIMIVVLMKNHMVEEVNMEKQINVGAREHNRRAPSIIETLIHKLETLIIEELVII